jgi:hypothetical protein
MAAVKVDERFRVSYEEGLRGLDLQSRGVDDLRTRAATLVTIGAVAISFISGLALRDGRRAHIATWVAFTAFGLMVLALCATVLRPRRFTFANDSAMLVNTWIDELGLDINGVYRHLAGACATNWEANEKKITPMHRAYAVATGLLAVSVLAALLDLAGRR